MRCVTRDLPLETRTFHQGSVGESLFGKVEANHLEGHLVTVFPERKAPHKWAGPTSQERRSHVGTELQQPLVRLGGGPDQLHRSVEETQKAVQNHLLDVGGLRKITGLSCTLYIAKP